jgi:hypothetical protein
MKRRRANFWAYSHDGERNAIANKLPRAQADWADKRCATGTVVEAIGGVVSRVGDETVGEMWSLSGVGCSRVQRVLRGAA